MDATVGTRGPLRAWARDVRNDYVFRRGMRRFLRDPAACQDSSNPVLKDLIRGWGNEGWSALDEYLAAGIGEALTADGPTLECGSGLSTLLLGAVAQSRGHSHWALEHTPVWAARVQAELDRRGLSAVHERCVPLKNHGAYTWYDAPLTELPRNIALVVCDGPPAATPGGRYGALPVLRAHLRPGCVILLDDGGRPEEAAIAERWRSETGASCELLGTTKPYFRLVMPGARAA